jgi:DNA-binding NarL/FixJ family response regulator
MVELLTRYSNRSDLLKPLLDVLRRIKDNDQTDEPGIDVYTPTGPGRLIQDRMTDQQVMEIIDCYRSGLTRKEVAAKFDVPERTIKWIMRKHGVRKRKPPD